ncbi:alpha/beta fold hydrolase [Streptomyces sp. NPDC087917]|uniref:alpha/beta fold hydrolase n=1 Tax=Streptomyces sp. NPDC087917 TaxID=3155060 RepID=UPI00342593FB
MNPAVNPAANPPAHPAPNPARPGLHPGLHSGLHPELDTAALTAFAAALESGDTTGLPPARAAEVEAVRAVAVFSRGKIAGAQGDLLDAALWRHTGSTPRPAVVMPSPWHPLGWIAYAVQASLLTARGHDVVAYTVRGFAGSEGQAELAGPLDVADGSRALDHLLERTAGPVTRIGFLGFSYGAAIAQLVAAHDPRVDSVVALSGWGDLGRVLYENSTPRTAAVRALLSAAARARLGARTQRALENVLADRDAEENLRWAERRSPLTHVKELNRRQVAVFLAHAWHETLFPPNQTLSLFNELTGPKRADLSVGDHGDPETTGLLGLPNRVWTDAHRWFDHHLGGVDDPIADEGEVLTEAMWTRTLAPAPTWHSLTRHIRRLHLTGAAELTAEPDPGWSATILCGVDTPTTVAEEVARSGHAELAGLPKSYPAAPLDPTVAASWTSEPVREPTRLRGTPRLRVTYRAPNPGSSFVAYLLDLAPDGTAHLVTHAPYTDLDPTPDTLVEADLDLQATAYDLPPGHRVRLVLTARDPFYGDANHPRATLAFTSPDATPSYVDLPLG